jgi:phytoene dehydrogenase-like protein
MDLDAHQAHRPVSQIRHAGKLRLYRRGSMALIDSLVKAIEWQGDRIHVNSPVSEVTVANGCVTGVSIKPSRR